MSENDEERTTKVDSAFREGAKTPRTLQVKDLIKRYNKNEIIKGISLDVHKGEVAVVIGPSGGGKSTFIRCINGLEAFQGGEVNVGEMKMKANLHPTKDATLLRAVR